MVSGRDDFSKSIKDILAKRVGYLCTNPDCRKPTIGSNEVLDKSTSIGEAAHITAASEGGPRFDPSLDPAERSSIDNGIWLCSNCATLIDKDPGKFTIGLLRRWKETSEEASATRLKRESKGSSDNAPYLEADLIFIGGARIHKGYSKKNPLRHDEKGNAYRDISEKPIIYWVLEWRFKMDIYNNSNQPAFNLKLDSIGNIHFDHIDVLPKINNLAPLANDSLKAKYAYFFEGTGIEADQILKPRIPDNFNDMKLKLTYLDSQRQPNYTLITFKETEIVNSKIID